MRRIRAGLVWIAVLLNCGCYSYSNYQSAKLLEPGRSAITPSASFNTFHAEGGGGEIDDWVFDVQFRGGVSRHFEIGAKFSHIDVGDGYHFIAIDPKYALDPERVAFSCPFGTFFGNDIESDLQVHPTIIARFPLEPGRSELNAAVKMLLFFTDTDSDALVGFNFGPRFSSDLDRWAIHPEIGLLFNPGDDGHFVQFGNGFMVSP